MISADLSRVELHYRITDGTDSADFVEVVTLPGPLAPEVDEGLFRDLARRLWLVAGLSYYKTTVPATVEVPSGLTASERALLAETLLKGLGEFAYRNQLPGALTPRIEAPTLDGPTLDSPAVRRDEPAGALVAVGGGKDSIVTIESLRALPLDVHLFSVNTYAPITRTAEAAGLPLLTASRRLDPLLHEWNAAGAHNGHVPVTAMNSVIGCLTALRAGLDVVVFSNEASSSYGNLTWQGFEVNHQWSKGLAFEGMLRDTLAELGAPVDYVSFLRPLSELAIMRRFATLTAYHPVFTSCNRSFHLDESKRRSWCADCDKCRFVFLTLAPYLSRDALLAIFGTDMLADPAQLPGFLDLLAVGDGHKPFECVGEPLECRAALTLLREHPEWRDHPTLALPELRDVTVSEAEMAEVFSFSTHHFLSGELEKAARAVL
ncbi:UDP-N-acetyl-alpha-D-muramoyl-L-alanyl-L-glutamat e epimerase [Nocardioides pacificus]